MLAACKMLFCSALINVGIMLHLTLSQKLWVFFPRSWQWTGKWNLRAGRYEFLCTCSSFFFSWLNKHLALRLLIFLWKKAIYYSLFIGCAAFCSTENFTRKTTKHNWFKLKSLMNENTKKRNTKNTFGPFSRETLFLGILKLTVMKKSDYVLVLPPVQYVLTLRKLRANASRQA